MMAEATLTSTVCQHTPKGRSVAAAHLNLHSDTNDGPELSSPDTLHSDPNIHKTRICAKIISSGRTIQSQQRGEPDLTEGQKVKLLASLMQSKPGSFLMRFGTLLDQADLDHIKSIVKIDYEVKFRLKELERSIELGTKSQRNLVKNRRFRCLNQLMENSDYFSDEEMRHRNPLLFEHYVGQYLTQEDKERLDMGDGSDMTLSGIILKKMKIDNRRKFLRQQQELESGQIQETDSDTEEVEVKRKSVKPILDEQERLRYHQEFLRAMQLTFLNGEDREFDYSKVDTSEEYDSLDLIGRDAEDLYFDEEEPALDGDKESVECDDADCTL